MTTEFFYSLLLLLILDNSFSSLGAMRLFAWLILADSNPSCVLTQTWVTITEPSLTGTHSHLAVGNNSALWPEGPVFSFFLLPSLWPTFLSLSLSMAGHCCSSLPSKLFKFTAREKSCRIFQRLVYLSRVMRN